MGQHKIGVVIAVAFIYIIFVILPIIIMYIFLQKNIINGVTTGAVKG